MHISSSVPTIFESFNARHLDPIEVAKTFVPPSDFIKVCKKVNTVVIGPRGSGKTTLLKMLHPSAVCAWEHPDAEGVRERIDYTSVFIGSDITWGEQLRSINHSRLSDAVLNKLMISAFTTHSLIALIETIDLCTDEHSGLTKNIQETLSSDQIVEFVDNIAEDWHLLPRVSSFLGILHVLRTRLSEIRKLASKAELMTPEQQLERVLNTEFLHLNFLESALIAIGLFNNLVGNSGKRWAFLFDELEVAPAEIRRELLASMRSRDNRIIFKLSISPYSQDTASLKHAFGAAAGNDYETVELFYGRKEDAYEFTHSLITSILRGHGIHEQEPQEFFGRSEFDIGKIEKVRRRGVAYQANSRVVSRFKELKNKDKTFKTYLGKRNIDLNKLNEMDDNVRASTVRKITSVVALRNAYRTHDRLTHQERRSRKKNYLYTGWDILYAATEGNPRWVIGLFSPMIEESLSIIKSGKNVYKSVQLTHLEKTSKRFLSLIRTISVENRAMEGHFSLITLIDRISNELHSSAVLRNFMPEPPNHFVIDKNISAGVLEILQKGVNAGALISLEDDGSIIDDLRGKAFRLSYLFAPRYGLLMTIGAKRNLSSLLGASDGSISELDLLSRLERDHED